jgi:two-component system nitrogen regulation sensor histidine kinase NtrY
LRSDNGLSPAQRQKKTKLERWGIVLAAGALLALTLVQREVISLGPGFSDSQGLVALVSINVSVLLTTVLLVLILRNLYWIFFERQGWGSLQTKMVMSFISLSLLPTLLIFY